MPKVTFVVKEQKTEVETPAGQTLLAIAQANKVPMESACGGNGFCMTCKCKVKEGTGLSPVNDREEAMGMTPPERLGCQAQVTGDVTVELE